MTAETPSTEPATSKVAGTLQHEYYTEMRPMAASELPGIRAGN